MRLVHGDRYPMNARVVQHRRGNALGERLDQVDGLACDDRGHSLCEFPVVDGIRDVIRCGGRRQRHRQTHIDSELLTVGALVVVYTVPTEHGESCQSDLVARRHGAHPFHAAATARASRVATTLCTRTAQTPARTASALVTAVARSRRASETSTS